MQFPDWAVQYWAVWAFGLLTGALAALWRYALAQRKRQKALEEGVRALLRDRIIQAANARRPWRRGCGLCCGTGSSRHVTITRKRKTSRCMAVKTYKACTPLTMP